MYRGKMPEIIAIHCTAEWNEEAKMLCRHNPDFLTALAKIGYATQVSSTKGGRGPDGRVGNWAYAVPDIAGMPLGAILGIGRLVAVVPTELIRGKLSSQEQAFGDYRVGRFAWVFDEMLRLEEPIPWRGRQQVWEWPNPPRFIVNWSAQAMSKPVGAI